MDLIEMDIAEVDVPQVDVGVRERFDLASAG
jgi:hypothetical protein